MRFHDKLARIVFLEETRVECRFRIFLLPGG